MSAVIGDDTQRIDWPLRGSSIGSEAYQRTRLHAEAKGIQLQGVKKSDIDTVLFEEIIDASDVMLSKYPELKGTGKKPFTIKLEAMYMALTEQQL